MTRAKLKVTRIGNSRGVRLLGLAVEKLSWEDTAREMAESGEDWSAWDATAADGMDRFPGQADR